MGDRFRTGQTVRLRRTPTVQSSAAGGYIVVRRLPDRGGEPQYRIKNSLEPHERVARESDLEKL
jgi:hypothetical protein